jgi:glutamyl-tRNA synthetase
MMLTNTTLKGNKPTVRTRFAPSPTGYLHVGGLRTALFAYLFARHNKGEFFLRIEDTDRSRYVPGAEEKLQESLRWAGLTWDNEEIIFQSKRTEVYKKYAEQLVAEKKAYRCFCSSEELDAMRKDQQVRKLAPKYDRRCLALSDEEVQKKLDAGTPFVIRFRIPDEAEQTIEYVDAIRGKVSFRTDTIDDQVLIKSDGFPTYHLASIVDDHESEITHVIRGEEWLPSTPKHILLYRAFGWTAPVFAHLSLLLNPDKSKLSKRQGDVAVEDYVMKGYLKEAIINFVALLGWNPGKGSEKEIFSLEELIENFSLEQVHKAGAVFDLKRLDWMNGEYIKHLSIDELYKKALPFIKGTHDRRPTTDDKGSEIFWKRVLTVERDRLERLDQVGEKNPCFFALPEYDRALLRWKKMTDEEIEVNLKRAQDVLSVVSEENWTREYLGTLLLDTAGDKRGEFLWPLRVALSGVKQSPPPQDIAWVIGKEETLRRIEQVIF